MSLIGADNRYRVIRMLGKGTYGEVYECADIFDNERRVAVKKLITKKRKRVGIP
jgi:serine/threonine protein kinase